LKGDAPERFVHFGERKSHPFLWAKPENYGRWKEKREAERWL